MKDKTQQEVATTEHDRVVARLPSREPAKRFPDLSRTRRLFKGREIALSQAVIDQRNGRL